MTEILETKDVGLLAEMNKEIQDYHYSSYPAIFKPYNKEAITHFFKTNLENENTKAYIARENGTAVGYILLFIINFAENPFQYERKYLLIDQLLVLKKYQSKGVGKQLLKTAVDFATTNKIELIELNHWTKNNTARQFFNSNGFEYSNEKMWKAIK